MPAMPTGTLMKKIQLQLICSVRMPPISGPIASAIADTPTQMPIAVPRWRGGKVADDDRKRRRVHQRRSDALDDACADQEAGAGREAARERGGREDRQADDEDPPAAEHVGELAAREHEHGEGERVPADHPLELGL